MIVIVRSSPRLVSCSDACSPFVPHRFRPNRHRVQRRRGDDGLIQASAIRGTISTGLSYDSIPLTDLPNKGPFQQLIPTDDGLVTEFGPGDQGYVGGRWWIDVNGDGEMNDGDAFFLCPLLGPGR